MAENAFLWSITASSNDVADPAINWAEGMSPGAVNNSARATMAGVARLLADLNGTITAGGTANSLAVTSNSGITALTGSIIIRVKASGTNTGAATLNLNTIGAKAIRVFDSGAEGDPTAGQIVTNGIYDFKYDTTANSAAGAWILLNPSPDLTSQAKVGDIKPWGSASIPTGWVLAFGQALSRTTFATLFGVYGTTYGVGDGTTTFNVPDLRGRIPAGRDDMGGSSAGLLVGGAPIGINGGTIGAIGGSASVTLTAAQLASHTHTGATGTSTDHTHTGNTGSNNVDHTHTVAPGTPSTTNGQFSGPGSIGWGGTVGTATTGGASLAHQHAFTTDAGGGNHTHGFTTAAAGSDGAHTNVQPIMILNYILKTG